MKRTLLSVASAMAVAVAVCLVAAADAHAQSQHPNAGGVRTGKNETYTVIQIINPRQEAGGRETNGPVGPRQDVYQVVTALQLKDLQKQLETEYKDKTYPEWQDAVKIDPKTPRPLKPSVKRLKTFRTQKGAEDYRQKLLDDLAAKEGGKPDKPK